MAELYVEQFDIPVEIGVDISQSALAEAELFFGPKLSSENKTDDVCCCRYWNAATCPDCGAGMVRLGGCCCCQSCGYETCGG